MANTLSAEKNARKAARRHTRRVAVKSELKTYRKKALAAAETKQSAEDVKRLTTEAVRKIAKAASNKYIHPRTAARKISRLVKAINRAQNA
ncbi:MAG: Ribosomal protein [Clostridiales bacterium]|jgi:small subunit ribosomal protein S20|nr:Ribosomal protein [Clostridiales bacterium]MDN5280998.1 Ribosomal protein [Candidatus Ozemobacter sp.]